MTAQVLQFLDHDLPILCIKTSKSFINDDGLYGAPHAAGKLSDGQ